MLCSHLLAAVAAGLFGQALSFPSLPLVVEGPNMIDSTGAVIKVAGTNWPGHNDVMVPEGLQYKSIHDIVSDVKSLGMNVIRLTFAIEMVDQIFDNDGDDIDLQTAFSDALGEDVGATVLAQVLSNNPQFTAATKRIEVFDAVVEELNSQAIYVNLDNHISSGEWCCGGDDGNTWWGDTYFDAANWIRGLAFMAEHGASWDNLMSISLRNELREPTNNETLKATYNWETWYQYMKRAADAVNAANPDPLIILSGLNYDTTMQPVVRGEALEPGTDTFSFEDFEGYADKLAIELHNYDTKTTSCANLQGALYNGGAQAMNPDEESTVNVFPVLVTEFGFDQTEYESVYSTCLAEWLPHNTAGWMSWVIAGSYYKREGIVDYDEAWGLYNHDWSAWRNPDYVHELLVASIAATTEP